MRRMSFLIVALLVCLVSVRRLQAQDEIITFDAPGASIGNNSQGTEPYQITPAGDIVGYYIDGQNVDHGFVRSSHGKFANFGYARCWDGIPPGHEGVWDH